MPPLRLLTRKSSSINNYAIIKTGDPELARANVTADYINRRTAPEPEAARGRGPEALLATAAWLRRAASDIRFEIHETVGAGEIVCVVVTMHAVYTGPFVTYSPTDTSVTEVFPATGRRFAVRQVHWFRIADDASYEHDSTSANSLSCCAFA